MRHQANILLVDLTTRVSGETPAIGSLEVAKFNYCHFCLGIASKVTRLTNNKRIDLR